MFAHSARGAVLEKKKKKKAENADVLVVDAIQTGL